jgi:hypothetical protein
VLVVGGTREYCQRTIIEHDLMQNVSSNQCLWHSALEVPMVTHNAINNSKIEGEVMFTWHCIPKFHFISVMHTHTQYIRGIYAYAIAKYTLRHIP